MTIFHYNDVIIGAIASQITSLAIVNSTVYSGADQRSHQSSASLAFVWGNHRGPVNSPHKWPVTRKMFPFDDVIMIPLAITACLWVGDAWSQTINIVGVILVCMESAICGKGKGLVYGEFTTAFHPWFKCYEYHIFWSKSLPNFCADGMKTLLKFNGSLAKLPLASLVKCATIDGQPLNCN